VVLQDQVKDLEKKNAWLAKRFTSYWKQHDICDFRLQEVRDQPDDAGPA